MLNATLLWTIYTGWLLLVNFATFFIFRYDKGQARRTGARRVPESTLLLLMGVGGVVGGGLAMWMRPRHKTRKPVFLVVLVLAMAVHLFIISQALGWTV